MNNQQRPIWGYKAAIGAALTFLLLALSPLFFIEINEPIKRISSMNVMESYLTHDNHLVIIDDIYCPKYDHERDRGCIFSIIFSDGRNQSVSERVFMAITKEQIVTGNKDD